MSNGTSTRMYGELLESINPANIRVTAPKPEIRQPNVVLEDIIAHILTQDESFYENKEHRLIYHGRS